MSERLTEDERARLRERLTNLLIERDKLAREAQAIADELAADDAERQEPGSLHEFRPRPNGPNPTDQGSV